MGGGEERGFHFRQRSPGTAAQNCFQAVKTEFIFMAIKQFGQENEV